MFRGTRRVVLGSLAISAATLAVVTTSLAVGSNDSERVRWQRTLLVQVSVADLDRAINFYTETLGFELQQRVDELQWARIDTGIDNVIIGLGAGDETSGSGSMSLNFSVADIDGARALLESRGVVFDGPTIDIPGVVQLADFKDPDGNRIRLAGHSTPD